MIPYQGLLFFYVTGLLLLPAVVLGLLGKPLKYYGLFFTAAMLVFIFSENGQLLALAAFCIWQALMCKLFFRLKNKSRVKFRVAATLSLIPLVIAKLSGILPGLGFWGLLGISYMTFRAVQVLIDAYDGKLDALPLAELSYFVLFFPSVAAGPIDRYRRFSGDLNRRISREEYAELLRRGIWKLMFGLLSGIVISGLILRIWLEPLPENGIAATVSYMYGYTFYLFFNFAGYSSMAIGTAYILGVKLPENFDMPFLSVDMKDFWSRWHISLSSWLRDYVYTRFVMGALKSRRFKNRRTSSYIGYAVTFAIMGAWHGLTPAYLLYGVYHGILMCINEALDLHWKYFKQMKRGKWARIILTVVTFHLFSFGLLIFSGRMV
ncbi:MAG: D-alanyl-lipoteichoic acid biosynthesis protein DltB [Oscillospiraceae bacterium]|nr:D-alanyl-lipoteichoic acid biosynthesis protein DltB [Oscillospiraceae bacterium]